MTWLLFMMGEYANIVLLSGLSVICSLAAGCRRSTSSP